MRIRIIGGGNVAVHLQNAWASDASLINPRTLEGLMPDADLYIVAVSDGAVEEVSGRVKTVLGSDSIVVHTCGSLPMLQDGVIYPMQTFSKDIDMDYASIPFFIEGRTPEIEAVLRQAAEKVSTRVNFADADMRKRLHVAAVFSCNFVNRMWSLAEELLAEKGLPFSVMMPLIEQTLNKAKAHSPKVCQTGPASRGDLATIALHMKYIAGNESASNLYSAISEDILKYYCKK